MKYFNPWLRKNSLTNKEKKSYYFEIPKPGFNEEYISRLISPDSEAIKIIDSLPVETTPAPDTSKH